MKVNKKRAIKDAEKKRKSKKMKHKPIPLVTASQPNKKQKVLIVAQELKFSRLLAGNDKTQRDRVLKALKKWLNHCFEKNHEFKEEDFTRVWKGLFYAVWMSDKPLIQEELCDNIANILDDFPLERVEDALLMFKAGLRVLATEWYGIDQHRMDKFMMLVRRYLRACFRCLKRVDWKLKYCQRLTNIYTEEDGIFAKKTPVFARNAISLLLHICDCYVEEIAKVCEGSIPGPSLCELLRPFAQYMTFGAEMRLVVASRRIMTRVLTLGDEGVAYEEKRRAWEAMGCPEGGPDALEKMSDDEEEEDPGSDQEYDDGDSKPLDPRAGYVNVLLSTLPIPSQLIAAMLRQLLKSANAAAHRRVKICAERFEKLAQGEYPLKVKEQEIVSKLDVDKKKSTKELIEFENQALSDDNKAVLKALGRRQRKRLLAKARAGESIASQLESIASQLHTKATHNGEWQVDEDIKEKEVTKKPVKTKKLTKVEKKQQKPVKALKKPEKASKTLEKALKEMVKATKELEKVSKGAEKATKKASKKLENLSKNMEKVNKSPEKVEKKTEKIEKSEKAGKKMEKIVKNSEKPAEIAKKSTKTDSKQKKRKTETERQESPKKVKNEPKIAKSDPKKAKITEKKKFSKTEKSNLVAKKSPEIKKSPLNSPNKSLTPKKVKFVLTRNCSQKPLDYYTSVRQSPNIPFDKNKKPTKTNLKPNFTPIPINPFLRKQKQKQ